MEALIWKDVPRHERAVYVWLVVAFFIVMGTYWLVRPLKTGVFIGLVGVEAEPAAKFGTLVVLLPVLLGYAQLVNFVQSPSRLVLIVGVTFAALFATVSFGCMLSFSAAGADRSFWFLGWLAYWTIESFGSVCVAMLWSVVASVVAKKSAHTLYPIIIVVCQVGAICGATVATFAKSLGFPALFGLAAGLVLGAVWAVRTAFHGLRQVAHGKAARGGDGAVEPSETVGEMTEPLLSASAETGLLEGLHLVAGSKYVFGICVISTFCEIIATILDFQMKVIVRDSYSGAEEVAAFMGFFGQMTNTASLVFALVGTQTAINAFGLRFCLLAYPLGCLAVTAMVFVAPVLSVLVFAMVCLKSFNYSLNNPSKELLYLRTSHDIKYKAKSWIDMFGTRGAKSIGSFVNQTLKSSKPLLLRGGSVFSVMLVAVWLVVASQLGREHADLVARDATVGEPSEQRRVDAPLVGV